MLAPLLPSLVRSAVIVFLLIFPSPPAAQQRSVEERGRALAWYVDESHIDELLAEVSARFHPQDFAIEHVGLVSVTAGKIVPDQTVVVKDGKIAKVGPAASAKVAKGTMSIDGRGKYLAPGLTDMHVHQLTSSSQHLLNIVEGVTSVRDMDGFPWTLVMRDRVRRGLLLAPNQYVTGQILNGQPMGFYARVVTTPEEGRAAVREQKAAGYDFIKVHNIMKPEVYAAVMDEAHKLKIDVVGHIPQGITVREAVQRGQKTLEHFKGFINDNTLTVSDEDWVTPVKGADVWLCPTFYTYRAHLRGEEALKTLGLPEMQYASWRDREDWRKLAATPVDRVTKLRQNILPMEKEIFARLRPVTGRFVAGTDSGGGYPFMVYGFALHEELHQMHEAGLSPVETLRAATSYAAAAMGRSREFGTIEPGKRADLLLLSADPLVDPGNLAKIESVVVRGTVLTRADLDEIQRLVRSIYDPRPRPPADRPTGKELSDMVARMERLHARGHVFRDNSLDGLGALLREEGLTGEAERTLALKYRP